MTASLVRAQVQGERPLRTAIDGLSGWSPRAMAAGIVEPMGSWLQGRQDRTDVQSDWFSYL